MSSPSRTLSLSYLHGSPVYEVDSNDPEFRRVYGAVYIKDRRHWMFPAFYPFNNKVAYDLDVIDLKVDWTKEALDWAVLQSTYQDLIQKRVYDRSFKFHTKPYEHQLDAFVFGLYNLRAGLLYDCGLGKTKCAIDIIRYVKQFENPSTKALVVVPLVILNKWADEIILHGGGELTSVIITGTPKKKRQLLASNGDVYICTYGTAESLADDILDTINYNIIVADESHNLQTHNSAKTKALSYISKRAPRRIIMSGTATLGDPRHLYGQLDFLGPFLHEENIYKFCDRFIKYGDEQRRMIEGYKNLDILNKRVYSVSVRRKKEDCLDLPERIFVPISYEVSKDQKNAYNDLIISSKEELSKSLRVIEPATITTRLIKLSQILSGYIAQSNKDPNICDGCSYLSHCVEQRILPYTGTCQIISTVPKPTIVRFSDNKKLSALMELIEMHLVDSSNKLIIWAHFLEELNTIESALNAAGINNVRIDGAVSIKDTADRIAKFNTDLSCRIYISQVAAGVGIDLTAANYMVYYSLDYDLGHYLQSMDRFYRIGQTRKTVIYTLFCKDSIDEYIYKALQNKEDISAAISDETKITQSEFIKAIARPSIL